MERPSCAGCFLTSSLLLAFFSTLILILLNRIFKVGIYYDFKTLSIDTLWALFMDNKTFVAVSFLTALLPTFFFAAVINDIFAKRKMLREKEMEETLKAYNEDKAEKFNNRTRPKPQNDEIDPSHFKPPSRSLPKNLKEK